MGNLRSSYDHDIEINLLKSKLDRFAENVSTKLDDLALETNHIKENKPYSIVILEDQINALKKEKLELRRTNNDQQERIINMSCTISDLKSTNRNLEDEKSSLLTAIRLIKSDYSKLGIKAAVREVENEGPATWKVPKQNARNKPASPQTEDSNVTSALETSNQYAIFIPKLIPTVSRNSCQPNHMVLNKVIMLDSKTQL